MLYLRDSIHTPDILEVDFTVDGKTVYSHRVPTVKISRYTKDDIFEKNLLMMLPFYIMRYEKQISSYTKGSEELERLLKEYEDIRLRLEKKLEHDQSGLFADMIDLITQISDHIFREEAVARKGVDDVMAGQVLELKSERLRAEGGAEEAKRMGTLIDILLSKGKIDEARAVATDEEIRNAKYKQYNL